MNTMNKYVVICREGSVLDVELNGAYGRPCLGFAYAKDEMEAMKKIIALHWQLTEEEGVEPETWCNLAAYQLADDADIESAEYVAR